MIKKCDQCGECCKLFFINLNEEEYKSGKFKTVFGDRLTLKFSEIRNCGANFLAKREDGSCIYLKDNNCSIHKNRPQVCRKFFCKLSNKKYEKMREIIFNNKQ